MRKNRELHVANNTLKYFLQNTATPIQCSRHRMKITVAIDAFGLAAGHDNPASARHTLQSPCLLAEKELMKKVEKCLLL